ncbi:MAG: 2-isopropylmalate synthase [Methanophagales archaeon]|nr:2-isopropylmalate synthase [Methanophagales archaeon]MCW3138021.1 2-isopropylmalate synthase [Methanophagales archaeon]MCW3139386.1 2-isopropylmalate synthase [Methanophagales archaeon]MCW7070318.1 2-isopropylmalate synthase [Methanophagales archaeon]MCW7073504.1 2-isopropylmalate synthase [Methanophagales archaeon]
MQQKDRIVEVFDTTLRDGEQTPGISFTKAQKDTIARQLDKLGVDVIEAGFPVSSKKDKEAVRSIAHLGLSARICGLARLLTLDIDACIDCDVDMIHIFVPSSEIQREHTTGMSEDAVKEQTYEMTRYVKNHGFQCMFSAMDATRTELRFLQELYRIAEEAGADIVNVPDTVGVSEPFRMYELVSEIYKVVKVPISIHCHNDFGLAVANSLAAVKAGASQVQVSVNGLGERAGNADLAETVMSLNAIYGLRTRIKTRYLFETAKLVERFSGVQIPITQPVVGENAFSHESGIHAHGVIKQSNTFEPGIMTPEMVGHRRRIVLGTHTGRHSIEKKLSEIGMSPSREQVEEILERVKELSASGKKVTDDDLYSIAEVVTGEVAKHERVVILKELSVMTGNNLIPTASLKAIVKGRECKSAQMGIGPVDAAIKAIHDIIRGEIGGDLQLKDFRIEAITGGSDALAEVIVGVQRGDRVVTARGVRGDIVMASVEAFINAVNRLMQG